MLALDPANFTLKHLAQFKLKNNPVLNARRLLEDKVLQIYQTKYKMHLHAKTFTSLRCFKLKKGTCAVFTELENMRIYMQHLSVCDAVR